MWEGILNNYSKVTSLSCFLHFARQGESAQTVKVKFTASLHVYCITTCDNRTKALRPHLFLLFLMASCIIFTCTATTDRTSTEIRLNSSKQPHAPVCTNPL